MRQELYATLRKRISVATGIKDKELIECCNWHGLDTWRKCKDCLVENHVYSLADCLRAIEPFCEIDSDGSFIIYKDGEEYGRSPKEWNLALPLHEQSDELGEWLMTVIK